MEELLEVSRQLTSRLKEALETALNAGDDDLLSVSIGDAFLDGLDNMLRAFETYCTKQVSEGASALNGCLGDVLQQTGGYCVM